MCNIFSSSSTFGTFCVYGVVRVSYGHTNSKTPVRLWEEPGYTDRTAIANHFSSIGSRKGLQRLARSEEEPVRARRAATSGKILI